MICRNKYCVYNSDEQCCRDEIVLDEIGACTSYKTIAICQIDFNEIREKQNQVKMLED